MNTRPVVVFHPSPFLISDIENIFLQIAPESPRTLLVVSDLLERAKDGITAEIREATAFALKTVDNSLNPVVLCTCSTIGPVAEVAGADLGVEVIRIDRPMAERAVSLGRRICVIAAVASTIRATTELLEQVALQFSKTIVLDCLHVQEAWQVWQKGDRTGYIDVLENKIRSSKLDCDAIVLAQGSMAALVDRLSDFSIPILASPKLGVEGVLERARK